MRYPSHLVALRGAHPSRRGSALLMSFLLLVVLIAIMAQLKLATNTEMRVAENDVSLTAMDLAIESALLEVYEQLAADGEAGGGGAEAAAPDGGLGDPGAGPGGGEEGGAVDSREDEWGRPARTTIGEVDLRILIQDEDSKINVLALLSSDEDEAEAAFERIKRVLEFCRGDSEEEIDSVDAERLVDRMRDALLERRRLEDELPITPLLTDDPEERDRSMLLSLRELIAYEPFHAGLFRDYRDDEDRIVHSLTSYLTVYSSVKPIDEVNQAAAEATEPADDEGEGDEDEDEDDEEESSDEGDPADQEGTIVNGPRGFAVNLNTAPPVVLKALMDDREITLRFWDEVVTYRNEEEEAEGDEAEDEEPVYDEFGEELFQRQVFDSLDELGELDGWLEIDGDVRNRVLSMLTVESHVFSIYVTARMQDDTGELGGYGPSSRAEAREEEDRSGAITRTVRSVVWRREGEDGWEIVPIVRWEVLDYAPYEVLDYPDEER